MTGAAAWRRAALGCARVDVMFQQQAAANAAVASAVPASADDHNITPPTEEGENGSAGASTTAEQDTSIREPPRHTPWEEPFGAFDEDLPVETGREITVTDLAHFFPSESARLERRQQADAERTTAADGTAQGLDAQGGESGRGSNPSKNLKRKRDT
ncbi:hypothetical protein HRR81_000636 [Exophiala dermatitidis]|nr:hypothetical protein HRR75_000321 [Exophiala dermatitidis]KAJ4536187.1 hypothetical protein HRR78_008626 [Exophiala dermatitidis]KAJ4581616.1 hypothetical protein HRR79_000636 [Exophiala dermatitidis]KAJ4584829.1 hypothetical protein HRR81_000636 [Exophiala dermatitidis]KAJ9004957.1 hypothetical protein HRR94_000636 [Exophiala dermatitidis]